MLSASTCPVFYFVSNPSACLTNSLTDSPDFRADFSSFRCSAGFSRSAIKRLCLNFAGFFGLPIRAMSYCITKSRLDVNTKLQAFARLTQRCGASLYGLSEMKREYAPDSIRRTVLPSTRGSEQGTLLERPSRGRGAPASMGPAKVRLLHQSERSPPGSVQINASASCGQNRHLVRVH